VSLAVDPSGLYLYSANQNSNTVSVFAIDTATGALTAAPGSPFAADDQPRAIAID
jgi:YVTN family beta-propeller protein